MPSLEYLLPCRLTSLDVRTNSLSLFHVIEQLTVVDPKLRPEGRPPLLLMEVIAVWRRGAEEAPADYVQRLTLTDPGGRETDLAVTSFRLDSPRHRVLPSVPPVKLNEEGAYCLRVYLAPAAGASGWGEPAGEYAFDVAYGEKLVRVKLQEAQKRLLATEVRGQGGYQSLLRKLQSNIVGDELVLTTTDAERLVRSAQTYGPGGFQNRLRPIVDEVQQQLEALMDAELGSHAAG